MKKRKNFIIFLGIILTISLGVYLVINMYSFTKKNDTIIITKNDNEITENIGNYRYIHIKLNGGSKVTPRQYKIINSKNEIVKEGNLEGEIEYEGECSKGEWKIIFNTDEGMQVDYELWSGNLKSRDEMDKLN